MKQQNKKSLMQQALGEQWHQLPLALQAHYNNNENGENIAEGELTIAYPKFMQWPLNGMRLVGALVNQRGVKLPTTVERIMNNNGTQYWHRLIQYPDGTTIAFKSRFTLDLENNEFIEYTNRFLGLKMKSFVKDGALHYESCGYVLELGVLTIPLPEWLALGHASIIESAINETEFQMDFRLKYPLLGEIFSYIGTFKTL